MIAHLERQAALSGIDARDYCVNIGAAGSDIIKLEGTHPSELLVGLMPSMCLDDSANDGLQHQGHHIADFAVHDMGIWTAPAFRPGLLTFGSNR